MNKITSKQLRETWLEFYKSKGHVDIGAVSLIGDGTTGVMFNVAGMQPLMPYLLGAKHPNGTRLCNVQGCVRTVDIDEIGEGRLIMGDGAAYHNVIFEAIFFKPEQHEIFDGEVIDIVDYGAFVRIGPMDGLIHVSQVTDDYINYDPKRGALLAKESNKTLDEGDLVRARAVSVSIKDESTNNIENNRNSKIPLTMRQNNLGRFEWIAEAKEKSKKG